MVLNLRLQTLFTRLCFVGLLTFFITGSHSSVGAGSPGSSVCSYTDALYKPHPEYRNRKYEYTLTISEPPIGKKNTGRWYDYYIHGYKDGLEVHRLLLSSYCMSGSGGCYLGGLEFIELDKNMAVSTDGPKDAPYAYVISGLGNKLTGKHVVFLTPEKFEPDFKGLNLWVLDSCNAEGK